jgi:Asp-tRNA(Asn)/Glu-tRNA(Gln) amidotransferase A subunit family amidase
MNTDPTTDALAFLGAADAADRIRTGALTSAALVEACLARISAVDPAIEAWAHIDPAYARAQAAECDRRQAAGLPLGPLHGVPVGLKDVIDTTDYPTEYGTRLLAGRQPTDDATVVGLLREAGAVIMGKTVTTELAMGDSGKTRNPFDPAHTPGGSSSGSAAAVAARMIPLALGTQTVGSVIRPAAFCGVFGYKPSYGAISRRGVIADAPSFDTVGLFANNVEDLALAGDVLMRNDAADPAMRPAAPPPLRETAVDEPPSPPRLAFVRTAGWPQAEATTQAAFEALYARLGDCCSEATLPESFDHVWDWHDAIVDPETAANWGALDDAHPGGIGDRLRARIARGRTATAVEYIHATGMRTVLNRELETLFERFDAILTPATTGEAPAGLESTGNRVFNTIWTFCGVPAVSLPLLAGPRGLPIGVQLVGRRRGDAQLLRTARWLADTAGLSANLPAL